MVETFFYGVNPIGQTIYLSGVSFKVIGLLAENSDGSVASMLAGSPDILMPYTTALKMNGQTTVSGVTIYMEDAEQSDTLEARLEEKMERWMYLNELNEKIQAQK